MFGIGPTELVVILVVALLVLGPKRLPEIARALGKGLAEFRRATADVTSELDEARIALEQEAREAARKSSEKRATRPRTPATREASGAKRDDSEKPESAEAPGGEEPAKSTAD